MGAATPQLGAHEERDYRAEREREGVKLYRRGAVIGLAAIVVFGIVSHLTTPREARTLELSVACIVALVATVPLANRAQRIVYLVPALGVVLSAIVGYAIAPLGAFETIAAALFLLVWMFGGAVMPHGERGFAIAAVAGLATCTATLVWFSPEPRAAGWFLTVMTSGITMVVAGVAARGRIARREFAARRALEDANAHLAIEEAKLAELNRELENRVRAQVDEIVTYAAEIERMNVQLRERVADRSRELAIALARLGVGAKRLAPGTILRGRTRIIAPLGAGGMGDVYVGEDLVAKTRVAVKTMQAGRLVGASHLRRFFAEAAAAAAVVHPAIVGVHHIDVTEDGQLFQLMEHVDGLTLAHRLAHGGIEPLRMARLGMVLADALAAAHDAGIVHRDIKPANVMLAPTPPGVRILDFGISKLMDAPDARGLTRPQSAMGTAAYMAPEQARDAADVTTAADVYSLGVVLYEAVAGRRPFRGEPDVVLAAHVTAPPPPLGASVPAELAALIERCLDKVPSRRPRATEVAVTLGAIANAAHIPDADEVARMELATATAAQIDLGPTSAESAR